MKIWKAIVKAVKLAFAFIALFVIVSMTVTLIRAHRNAKHINEMAARLRVGMTAHEVAAVFPEDYFTGWIRPLDCKGAVISIHSAEEEADLKSIGKGEVPCEQLVSAMLRGKSAARYCWTSKFPARRMNSGLSRRRSLRRSWRRISPAGCMPRPSRTKHLSQCT